MKTATRKTVLFLAFELFYGRANGYTTAFAPPLIAQAAASFALASGVREKVAVLVTGDRPENCTLDHGTTLPQGRCEEEPALPSDSLPCSVEDHIYRI